MRSRHLIPGLILSLALATQAVASGLTVTKTVAPNPVPAGAPVTWTLRILNPNPGTARDVNLRDTLPAGVTEIAASSDVFQCSVNGVSVACSAKELPTGISLITISGIAPRKAPVRAPIASTPAAPAKPPRSSADSATARAPAMSAEDPMETIANLRLTIGKLEGERDVLEKRTIEAEGHLAREIEGSKRIAGELEEGKAIIAALEERATTAEETAARLKAELGRSSGDALALQEQLKAVHGKLDATQAAASAGSAEIDSLHNRLAQAEAQLLNAAPLDFEQDCPPEANSQKWLLANLPILLESAMANPTPRNARAFLCAQRAATTNGDFGRATAATSGAFIPNGSSSVTDGKLRMHRAFPGSPSPADIETLRMEAMRGSAEAMNDLGVLSLVGEGVPFDQALAERNLTAAAASGSALAAANLAVMFDRGVGVHPDAPAATQWRRYATAMGRKDS